MKKPPISRLTALLALLLAVCAVVAGLCLIVACYGIYAAGGEQPYTYQTVKAAFAPIAPVIYVCLGVAAVNILLHLIFPAAYKEPPLRNQPAMALRRIKKRRDLTAGSPELQAAARKESALRRRLYILCAAVFAVCAAVFLTYALNGANFHQTQINQSMARAMYVLLPCLAVSLAFGLFVSYRCRASLVAEGEIWKQCPKRQPSDPEKALPDRRPAVIKACLLLLGVVLLVYGFLAGGGADVLTKAVNICTECVGLG